MGSLDITGLPADKVEYLETLIRKWRNEALAGMENCGQKADGQESKQQLAEAARTLLKDYEEDEELTVFTALDGETLHE